MLLARSLNRSRSQGSSPRALQVLARVLRGARLRLALNVSIQRESTLRLGKQQPPPLRGSPCRQPMAEAEPTSPRYGDLSAPPAPAVDASVEVGHGHGHAHGYSEPEPEHGHGHGHAHGAEGECEGEHGGHAHDAAGNCDGGHHGHAHAAAAKDEEAHGHGHSHGHSHGHGHAHDGDFDFEDHAHGHGHAHDGGGGAVSAEQAAAALEAARSAPEEAHLHDDGDHGETVKRQPLCVKCTGGVKTEDGSSIEYVFDVLQGGVPQSGSLTPIGGVKVGDFKRRYSEFDTLKSSLTKIMGELAALNDKFPKKYLYGNTSDAVIAERQTGLELWMNYVLRTPTAEVTESAELSEFLMPITEGESKPAKFAIVNTQPQPTDYRNLIEQGCF